MIFFLFTIINHPFLDRDVSIAISHSIVYGNILYKSQKCRHSSLTFRHMGTVRANLVAAKLLFTKLKTQLLKIKIDGKKMFPNKMNSLHRMVTLTEHLNFLS